jgi:hypothetical protein
VRRLSIKSEDGGAVARQGSRLEDLEGGETGAAGVMKKRAAEGPKGGRTPGGDVVFIVVVSCAPRSFLEIYSHSQQLAWRRVGGGRCRVETSRHFLPGSA